MTTGNEPPVPAEQPDSSDPDTTPAHLRRQRDGRGRFTRSIKTVRRDAAAVDYLADHPGTTYQNLADLFGYYDRAEARRGVDRAKADVARPAVTKLIADESQELDALYTEAVAILQRHHVTVSHGRIVMWRNPDTGQEEPLADDGPKLAAIQVALRVRESYRRLHGLDSETKVNLSGSVRYEVVGVDPDDLK
jgi:hypothetical protein